MNLSAPFIRRPVATLLLAGALALLGALAYARLPVAPLPQVDFPTIQVTATLPGASATTMAASVATPLESQLGQIAGVTELTSFSAQGATSITIQFDLGTDINADAQAVQEALTAASRLLPTDMTTPPTWKKLNPADAPILVLAATSDSLPLTTVSDYVQNVLARDISQVSGVAQVSIGGEQKPAIRVQVDPARLAAMGLTLEQIRPALVAATTDAPKGSLDTPTTGFTIAANDQVTTAAAFDDVVVAHRNGASIRVRDIGRAVAAAADRTAAAYYNRQPAILLTIYRQPGANVMDTVRRIEAKLPALSAVLPAAITLDTVLNRTTTIQASVEDVEFTLVLTLVLVVLIVGLFLRNLRATLVPGATIALVVVENIHRHVEAGAPPLQAALAGTREIGFTVLAMSLSLIAVLLPIGFMSGIVGRLFSELAFTVIAAAAVSLVASLTFAPMLSKLVVRGTDPVPERAPRAARDWFKSVA